MKCPACCNVGKSEGCAFCHEPGLTDLLEKSIKDVKMRLSVEKGCWSLNGRYWHKFADEIVEVTEEEMTQLKNGRTLVQILENRLEAHE